VTKSGGRVCVSTNSSKEYVFSEKRVTKSTRIIGIENRVKNFLKFRKSKVSKIVKYAQAKKPPVKAPRINAAGRIKKISAIKRKCNSTKITDVIIPAINPERRKEDDFIQFDSVYDPIYMLA
jgi:hypothetical protein